VEEIAAKPLLQWPVRPRHAIARVVGNRAGMVNRTYRKWRLRARLRREVSRPQSASRPCGRAALIRKRRAPACRETLAWGAAPERARWPARSGRTADGEVGARGNGHSRARTRRAQAPRGQARRGAQPPPRRTSSCRETTASGWPPSGRETQPRAERPSSKARTPARRRRPRAESGSASLGLVRGTARVKCNAVLVPESGASPAAPLVFLAISIRPTPLNAQTRKPGREKSLTALRSSPVLAGRVKRARSAFPVRPRPR